jgi:hypothetical protein
LPGFRPNRMGTSRRQFLAQTSLAVLLLGIDGASAQAVLAEATSPMTAAEYQRRLAEYLAAREDFETQAKAYWSAISDKRRVRNAKRRDKVAIALDDYVLDQPPVYSGPKRPVDPSPQPRPEPGRRSYIPVVSDFLAAASAHFQFVPERADELTFKRTYAQVAKAYGLTREQAARVYSFETGGNGRYDVQSGLETNPNARAISTAIGYNQLLTTNSVELLAEQGSNILEALSNKMAQLNGPARTAIARKIAVVRKMIAVSQSVSDDWSEHEKLGNTEQGWALHSLALDIDVGPLLQTHKLLTSVIFARQKGYQRPLTAAELEMMNLTGDGTGLDMVTMPQAMRLQVPTANFFQRSGYERNPVAIRNNTVAKLLAVTDSEMDSNSKKPGARDLAAAFEQ